jgi:hypothetical protein
MHTLSGTTAAEAKLIRSIVIEEIERYIPHRTDRQRLTVPECMRRYRCRRDLINRLISSGELRAVLRQKGKNGRPQYMVLAESAEQHPLLGGALG